MIGAISGECGGCKVTSRSSWDIDHIHQVTLANIGWSNNLTPTSQSKI